MSIADEIREAAEEMAFSFTQEQWEIALLDGWKEDKSMGAVLVRAAGLGRLLEPGEWERLQARASELLPAMSVKSKIKQPCRAWIATHATYASDALWNGDFALAKRLFKKGGRAIHGMAKHRREVKSDEKDLIGLRTIRARSLIKLHDWNTVK